MIWDAESDISPEELLQLKSPAQEIAWSPDGKSVAFGLEDSVVLWDIEQSKETIHQFESPTREIAWSPDGRLIAFELEGSIVLWDIERNETIHSLEVVSDSDQFVNMIWLYDSRTLIVSGTPTTTIWHILKQ